VYLVEQAADDITTPHFHTVPQFQIFSAGDGHFGKEPIKAPLVHFADSWTAYGPIVAGTEGVNYFTARLKADLGANYMPESRQKRPPGRGRHYSISLDDTDWHNPSTRGGDNTIVNLLDVGVEGLGVLHVDVPPAASLELPRYTGAGRLIVVLDGALRAAGATLPKWTWGIEKAEADDEVNVVADHMGACVLALDYPLAEWTA
jgi:hypothetical protein